MNRRAFVGGLLAMPAVVAASSLMPVRGIVMDVRVPITISGFNGCNYKVGDVIRIHLPNNYQIHETKDLVEFSLERPTEKYKLAVVTHIESGRINLYPENFL